jgi:methionyl-tRNA formyltransferase
MIRSCGFLGGERGVTVAAYLERRNTGFKYIITENPSIFLDQAISAEIIDFHSISASEIISILSEIEICIAAGFAKILPEKIVNAPRYGILNCHGGKLPEFRGPSPVVWQILEGEHNFEANLLVMREKIDDGPVIENKAQWFGDNVTSADVIRWHNNVFPELVLDALSYVDQNRSLPKQHKQPEGLAKIWTRRFPRDSKINVCQVSAESFDRLVRAMSGPYPAAFAICLGKKLEIFKCKVSSVNYGGQPGRYIGVREGLPTILCSSGSIALETFQPSDFFANLPYGVDFE